MKQTRLAILGNGGAACHAVLAARGAGFTGEIHMLSDVREPAFNPMLAPYYLKGRLSWENCFPFGADFYQCHNVTCHFGSPATHVDAYRRTIQTADGLELTYDKCLVATGADAAIPPVPGLQGSPYTYPLRTSASTRSLESIMNTARKVVILGASLVGMKIAELMVHKNARVIVVDVAEQVMPVGAHSIAAGFLLRYFEEHGVEFFLGCSMQGLEERGSGVCCFFPSAIVEDADFIGVCTGTRPNLGFINRAQVDVDLGIVIDQNSQSNVPGLYAAGDCAQSINPMTGKKELLGTWANACYQGRAAGRAMAGRPSRFEGVIPQHISPFFDWVYAQVGNVHATGENVRLEITGNPFEDDGKFMLLVYDGDTLVGANLINSMEHIGSIKRAIASGKNWFVHKPDLVAAWH